MLEEITSGINTNADQNGYLVAYKLPVNRSGEHMSST
jgi:hypothetical protein